MSLWRSRHHVTFSMAFGRDAAIVVEPGAVVSVPDRWDELVVSRKFPVELHTGEESSAPVAVPSADAPEEAPAPAAPSVPPVAAPAPVAVVSEPAPEVRRTRPQGSAPVAK